MTGRQGLSEREYARHAGLSRPAVAKARLLGKLVLFADGSIDAAASDRRRGDNTDPARQPEVLAGQRPVPEAALASVNEALKEQGLPTGGAAGGGVTFVHARTSNEVMKAHERRLQLQKMRGDLVDRNRATATVFRLARQERDAWLVWPVRVAAQMAAELVVDTHRMEQVLETYVRSHLAELADIRVELR
ncbi:MAG: elements of external origin [Rhodospirillales bacterium]